MAMHVISRKRITEFCDSHPEAKQSLTRWYHVVRKATWTAFADVRATFNACDQYHRCLIFNIGGNKDRIIAAVHYNARRVYIRSILTHEEYDKGNWKEQCDP